jgi:ABC-type transport system involved in cytochrome c biogenesis permease subunit
MTKSSKTILFFLAVVSLVAGVIYAGERYAAKLEVDWFVVIVLVSVSAFLMLVSSVIPDIEGPAQAIWKDSESDCGESDGSDVDSSCGDSSGRAE